jgi:hypothetical protein
MNIQLTNTFQKHIMFISWGSPALLSSFGTAVMPGLIITLSGRCISPMLGLNDWLEAHEVCFLISYLSTYSFFILHKLVKKGCCSF